VYGGNRRPVGLNLLTDQAKRGATRKRRKVSADGSSTKGEMTGN
jgi:hypothetical protein